jgi:hypothetical protein
MFEDNVTVPAGWYPDPMGLPQLRWWNNHAWTELTTEARPPLVVQTPTRLAFADDELPTRRQQREQRERDEEYATLATDEDEARDAAATHAPLSVTLRELDAPAPEPRDSDDLEALTEIDDEPSVESAQDVDPRIINLDTIDYDSVPTDDDTTAFLPRPALFRPHDTPVTEHVALDTPVVAAVQPSANADAAADAAAAAAATTAAATAETFADRRALARMPIYTASVWIIALVPILLLVLSLLLLIGFGSSLTTWVTPAIWATSYLAVVILAITDRAALGHAGYEHRASWAWALLTAPIYLIARSMSLAKVGRLGFAPVLVWAALGILQIGSLLVVPGLIISALPHVFALQAEQSIASDASIIGADITVNCASNLPVLVGQSFDCVAKSATKDSFTVTASLQRRNGWINWHVDDWGIYTLSR